MPLKLPKTISDCESQELLPHDALKNTSHKTNHTQEVLQDVPNWVLELDVPPRQGAVARLRGMPLLNHRMTQTWSGSSIQVVN